MEAISQEGHMYTRKSAKELLKWYQNWARTHRSDQDNGSVCVLSYLVHTCGHERLSWRVSDLRCPRLVQDTASKSNKTTGAIMNLQNVSIKKKDTLTSGQHSWRLTLEGLKDSFNAISISPRS